MSVRHRPAVAGLAAVFAFAAFAAAQEPPAVREQVEVREVPVLVELPASLRTRPVDELAGRIVLTESGITRELAAAAPVAPPAGAGFTRVTVALDRLHCDDRQVRESVEVLSSSAARLVELGPVDLAQLSGGAPRFDPATRDAEALATAIARLGAERCAARSAPEAPTTAGLDCPGVPCLLLWIGGAWTAGENGAAAERSIESSSNLARELARGGWTVFAIAPLAAEAGAGRAPAGETRPGEDQTRWTVDVRRLGREEAPASEEEYGRYVDLDLAPLRRLVAATAGELAARVDEIAPALDALAGRTLLYYRTDRPVGGDAALELREAGTGGRRLRAPEWAVRAAAPRR
jgi:hypothetical protein